MRIYIAEDDPSVIGVLEDILESSALGRVCGASEEGAPDPERIMALDPDLVLVDLLMPGRDGIQLVRELKELGSRAKFVMISQVSAKELIAKAYQAGVEFFIQKPINLIEVRQVVGNVIRQMENERALHTIQSVFQSREPQPAAPAGRQEVWRRRIQYILSQLGMAGEKGAGDIMELCLFLLEHYGNEFFTQYAAVLFPFPEVRAEMAHLRGKGGRGKVNLKKFLDGMLILTEEY